MPRDYSTMRNYQLEKSKKTASKDEIRAGSGNISGTPIRQVERRTFWDV